jgi:predicted nucleic acid-binding protein
MTTMPDLVVDTDILIDVGRRIPEATTYVQTQEQHYRLLISTITALELMIGARNKTELRKIERFIQRFVVIKTNEAIADTATSLIRQYRLSHGLLLADAFVAATAIIKSAPLASKNQRDYRFIAQLTLLPYP